ncbi:hypothetical protein OG413_31555 [Streptomyces sp. NBC_01433]|uniref:hypothetical protein n=1 Tax=Streptomyces sp. NBC_01433 TaxID=2903864 RepID=UPI00224D0D30|nr:hypothetical protein [Streptomyces sp. NBC_01433]MCX4679767.1 hypothetical protein [Streptomyces sp. NBC_01433]
MRPERDEGTGGGGPLVPMAWMYTEYIADELLRTGDLMEPTTLEFRAGRDALALTIFLCDGPVAGALPEARVTELRLLTAYGAAWRQWVCERLDDAARRCEPGDPDLALARAAWRWLEETELLAADLGAIGPPPWEPPGRGRDSAGAVRADADRADRADGLELRDGSEPGDGEENQVWTPAWQLGLPLGHLAVHLC